MREKRLKNDTAVSADRNGFVRCRVCGCTEIDACSPPCSWAEDNLCSHCDAAVQAYVQWFEGARRPNRAALAREIARYLSPGRIDR